MKTTLCVTAEEHMVTEGKIKFTEDEDVIIIAAYNMKGKSCDGPLYVSRRDFLYVAALINVTRR